MKVVIRADASLNIGTGHVMRCLTLAEALKKEGVELVFICREHDGHLLERIVQQGFEIYALPNSRNVEVIANEQPEKNELYGQCWLGSTQQQDAELCRPLLEEIKPDWLIVDHYGINKVWQIQLVPYYGKLMVIDDLANREHQCDLLLDQTYGRKVEDYTGLVPQQAQLLLGSEYALLRPEFNEWRGYSLQRRRVPEFKKLLITMGGVDPDNMTGEILAALEKITLPDEIEITVVMGAMAPHLESVEMQVELMPNKIAIKVNVTNMAELMANADLAVGAAGATTWERCCLGLPCIQIVLAENQKRAAYGLKRAGAALSLSLGEDISSSLRMIFSQIEGGVISLKKISKSAEVVANGTGCQLVVNEIRQ